MLTFALVGIQDIDMLLVFSCFQIMLYSPIDVVFWMCLAQNFSLSVFYILFPSFCFCLPSFFQFSFLISVVNIYFLLFIDFYCLVLVLSSVAQPQVPAGLIYCCEFAFHWNAVFVFHRFWHHPASRSAIEASTGTNWSAIEASSGTNWSAIEASTGNWRAIEASTGTNWSAIEASTGTNWSAIEASTGNWRAIEASTGTTIKSAIRFFASLHFPPLYLLCCGRFSAATFGSIDAPGTKTRYFLCMDALSRQDKKEEPSNDTFVLTLGCFLLLILDTRGLHVSPFRQSRVRRKTPATRVLLEPIVE